jgi:hypothetical protein
LHVLGTPPAFVLSQDQTLHRDSRPAASTSKRGNSTEPRIRESPCSDSMHGNNRPRNLLQDFQSLLTSLFDSQPFPFPANRNREDCPHWLLALTISFSRSDRAHTDQAGVGAGCPKGLFQTCCNCWKVSFGRREALGGLSGGRVTLSGAHPSVNAFRAAKSRLGASPRADRHSPSYRPWWPRPRISGWALGEGLAAAHVARDFLRR